MATEIAKPIPHAAPAPEGSLTARAFRSLVDAFEHATLFPDDAKREAADRQRRELRDLINHHMSDAQWRELLQQARMAAQGGAREFQLMRFPSADCSDDGRAISAAAANWPATLTGDAADAYRVWRKELDSKGFHFVARILEYTEDRPGDVGLYLSWGTS
jgi:hypothetical protein